MLTEQEIVHGSSVIASYMGAKVEQSYSDVTFKDTISGLMFYWGRNDCQNSPDAMNTTLPLSGLKYHTSWSALMPVYIKANKEIHEKSHYDSEFAISADDFQLNMWNNFEDEDCNIESLFRAIVGFIDYLNQEYMLKL